MANNYRKSCRPNFFERQKLKIATLKKEMELIITHFNFIESKIEKGILSCRGKSRPTEYSKLYEFRITYDGFNPPSVFVDSPDIEYNDDIHMFPKDNSLCLYHKSDLINEKWDYKKYNLYNSIIPWTIEWFIFYEIYLLTGKWEHPFISHKKELPPPYGALMEGVSM